MDLLELIVVGRVGNRSQMENGIEFFLSELLSPVQFREVGSGEISLVTGKIFEIARAKIIDHGQP